MRCWSKASFSQLPSFSYPSHSAQPLGAERHNLRAKPPTFPACDAFRMCTPTTWRPEKRDNAIACERDTDIKHSLNKLEKWKYKFWELDKSLQHKAFTLYSNGNAFLLVGVKLMVVFLNFCRAADRSRDFVHRNTFYLTASTSCRRSSEVDRHGWFAKCLVTRYYCVCGPKKCAFGRGTFSNTERAPKSCRDQNSTISYCVTKFRTHLIGLLWCCYDPNWFVDEF